jgi:hypothetical protein
MNHHPLNRHPGEQDGRQFLPSFYGCLRAFADRLEMHNSSNARPDSGRRMTRAELKFSTRMAPRAAR